MTSTRERALTALLSCLETLRRHGVTVERGVDVPTEVPPGGLVVLRDGDPGEPEVELSPLRHYYRHDAAVEVIVQRAPGTARAAALDDVLVLLGDALGTARPGRLGGAVDELSWGAPSTEDERIEGAPAIRGATVPVVLAYTTTNPLK